MLHASLSVFEARESVGREIAVVICVSKDLLQNCL